jgi:hypothetical protein
MADDALPRGEPERQRAWARPSKDEDLQEQLEGSE